MSTDLIEWLRVQLDEDERVAKAAADPECYFDMLSSSKAEEAFMLAFDPARVIAEVAAKRRIIDEHSLIDPCDAHDAALRSIPCETLRLLASVYAGRPGWREEWCANSP